MSNCVVVYESVYGDTRAIAEAVAEGFGGAEVVPVHEAHSAAGSPQLLIVGGPTHIHALSRPRTLQAAVDAAGKHGTAVEPGAMSEPGLRRWLQELPDCHGVCAAAFDTRLAGVPALTGSAAQGIARRLHRRGYEVIGTDSFVVKGSEGPLADGELERARAWGARLAQILSARLATQATAA